MEWFEYENRFKANWYFQFDDSKLEKFHTFSDILKQTKISEKQANNQ